MINRPTIAGIMVATAAVAVVLAAPRYVEEPLFWVALLAIPWLLPWMVTPVALRRNRWAPIDFGHGPFDPSDPDVPEEVAARLRRATDDMEAIGFARRGCFRSNPTSHVYAQYLGLFERPATWEVARVMANATPRGVDTTLVLQTTFADGVELVTSDSGALPPWPRREGVLGMPFPEARSTADLFEIHRAMVSRHGRRPVRELPASEAGLVDHLRATVEKNRAWSVSIGFQERDEARGVYRPTWKAAFWNAWGRLRPVGPVRMALRRRRARRMRRELGLLDGLTRP